LSTPLLSAGYGHRFSIDETKSKTRLENKEEVNHCAHHGRDTSVQVKKITIAQTLLASILVGNPPTKCSNAGIAGVS